MSSVLSISDFNKVKDLEKKYSQKELGHDYFKIFSHYVQSSTGSNNLFKLLIAGCSWPIHFARDLGLSLETLKKLFEIEGGFIFIAKNLILAKYPKTLEELSSSYEEYRKTKISDLTKTRDKFASKVAQAVADSSLLIQLGEILSLYSLGVLSPVVNFSGNLFSLLFCSFSLKINSTEYFEHKNTQKIIEDQRASVSRLKILFHEIINLDLLNIAKSVVLIALNALLVLNVLYKTTLASIPTLLLLSTCATVLAISSHFYKESMTYPLIF
jgi:hypothetical protein